MVKVIEVEVGTSWPTPTHILRAAEAIDAISIPRIGDVLRATVAGIERGAAERKNPWDAAEIGEFWALQIDGRFEERLFKVTEKGFVHAGQKHTALGNQRIIGGRKVWPLEIRQPS